MELKVRSALPILFLIAISIFWANYYQSHSELNNFGNANFEWLFLIDSFVALPIICLLCIREKKKALVQSLFLCLLAIWIGSYIIPASSKIVWPYLEMVRYVSVPIILIVECSVVLGVILVIKATLDTHGDIDKTIDGSVRRVLGSNSVAKFFGLETRVWTFFLMAHRISPSQFSGKEHFSYHNKDQAKSNALGFLVIMIAEAPIMHIFLHYVWSPIAANIISLLTVIGIIFFVADYRAMSRRPISITDDALMIRFGVFNPLKIALKDIASISAHASEVPKNEHAKQYNYFGHPNVRIALKRPVNGFDTVYLGLDQPNDLIKAVQAEVRSH
ncbi:hypothetical protein [Veronia pacifica]|uniref:Beta-carotene 15,15'-monooxygenase n=1 Tax=Veronia pacifica TaxID=1080227 RepID=A0A1C3ER74_9GAMM|nr:hypothetical protein [Veronia pacifica]ODA35709.1 hypothetical protein A8L45_03635 [Veronia pacifica]